MSVKSAIRKTLLLIVGLSVLGCVVHVDKLKTPFGEVEGFHLVVLEDLPEIVQTLAAEPRDEVEQRVCQIIAALEEAERSIRSIALQPGMPPTTANQMAEIADHYRRLADEWRNTAKALGVVCQ